LQLCCNCIVYRNHHECHVNLLYTIQLQELCATGKYDHVRVRARVCVCVCVRVCATNYCTVQLHKLTQYIYTN